jgi:hypothetical protein
MRTATRVSFFLWAKGRTNVVASLPVREQIILCALWRSRPMGAVIAKTDVSRIRPDTTAR